MGVNISELVTGRQIELGELRGKRIAIDAYNTLYQFLSIIRDRFTGEPLRDSRGAVTSHLSGILYRTSRLMEHGVEPIYVFDGKPPEFKRATAEKRSKIRSDAEVKWKEAVERKDTEAVRRYSQQASRLTGEMIQEAKKLLDAMGVSWVQAPSEGEAEASYLVREEGLYATGSQDWDSLLFGAPRLVRNLTITGRRKVPRKEKYMDVKPEVVELESVLSELGLTQEQLIILGILVGTDYNPGGIKGTGPKTALKLVKEGKTLEGVFGKMKWDFEVSAQEILDFFRNPPVEKVEIRKSRLDPGRMRELMVEEHSFSRERVDKIIEKLEELREGKKQTGLEKFLGK